MVIHSCSPQHSTVELENAIHHYDQLITKMDADSIAYCFEPDGDLGNEAQGRDSIRKFLGGFKDKHIRVLSLVSNTFSILLRADSATQKESYEQVDLVNATDTIKVKGHYEANWIWVDEQGWRIRKMQTFPG